MSSSTYRCLLPFTDPSPSYVHGFEAGKLYYQMEQGIPVIDGMYHLENMVVIQRMCMLHGYTIDECTGWDEDWCHLRCRKQ